MQRIWADFARLGRGDSILLGTDASLQEYGYYLEDGAPALFYEEGSLVAEGILQARIEESDGVRFWYAIIDLATMRDIDEVEQSSMSQAS